MNTEERLGKLEQRNRILLIGLALAVVIFALGALADERTFNVIQAKRFILKDERGLPRAMPDINKSGPYLRLFDANEKPSIDLAIIENEPSMSLFGENRNPRVMLYVSKNTSGLRLFNANGKPRAGLVMIEGRPGLSLEDDNGKTRAAMLVVDDGPNLTLFDPNGKVRWETP